MFDYLISYKSELSPVDTWSISPKWDIFISAYNDSERVRTVFSKAPAVKKFWLMLPEYRYEKSEYPDDGEVFVNKSQNESTFLNAFWNECELVGLVGNSRICVDITGFMRPHILYLMMWLKRRGVKGFDAIYSEPDRYGKKEETAFSEGSVYEVRPVTGYEGSHETDVSQDILVVSIGYDHELIAHVADNKDHAVFVPIFGLPSLRAEMYQESQLRMARASESIQGKDVKGKRFFSSANDPFVTAATIDQVIAHLDVNVRRNIFLSPLSTKPQTLGFGLAYINRFVGKPVSIIFPFRDRYRRETSVGLTRVWRYEIRL
ncbi:MAG: hypothetical protein KF771_05745 [Burkholderiales bacterium]|nr:hypothetical protein [Burkholderiales bacterium]